MSIYLDYNASTPVHPSVLEEMFRIYRECPGNASSRTHSYGQSAAEVVRNARKTIAGLLNTGPEEIVFTSGATESNNQVLLGLQEYGEDSNKKHIISSGLEHKSILEPLQFLASKGFEVELLKTDSDGRVGVADLARKLREDTLLISLHHANNETGIIQPIEEIGDLLAERDVFFHVDAAQTFGKLALDLGTVNIDFLTATAHKMGGPQGVGLLVLRKKNYRFPPVTPLMRGGDQEFQLRPGTLPVALIGGFGKAAKIASENLQDWYRVVKLQKNNLLEQLQQVPHRINGDPRYSMPNTLNVSFPGVNSEALLVLTKQFYALSNGSACTAASYGPSHVLLAMGLTEEIANSAVRISWGFATKKIDLGELLKAVKFLSA